MESFLRQSINYLKNTKQEQIPKAAIILPTKRAVAIFKNMLKKQKLKAASVISIDDFIVKMTGQKPSGTMPLLLELYDTFRNIQPKTKLDKFMAWGYILLRDFDQIDRNLLDADKVFSLLADIQKIKKWGLEEHQITERIKRYFALWENLKEVYLQFTNYLKQTEQAYEGLLYRRIAENAEEILIQKSPFDFYIFIGFNALSKSEEAIFKFLKKQNKVDFIWDADSFYFDKKIENRAVFFLQKYKNTWASEDWNFEGNFWQKTEKNILSIQVSNASQQGRVANQLLKNWEVSSESKERTVIVLPDESVLLSILHALSNDYDGLNITMGVSMRHSSLFNWLEVFFELHTQTKRSVFDNTAEKKEMKFYYQSIIKVFAHPFVKQYEQIIIKEVLSENKYENVEELSFLQFFIQQIHQHNLFYLSEDEIYAFLNKEELEEFFDEKTLEYYQNLANKLSEFLELLFSSWRGVRKLIQKLLAISEVIPPNPTALNEEHIIRFREILQEFEQMLNKLKKHKPHLQKEVNLRTFRSFLYQALREETITFDSERESPLQIMGILETRSLDFDNVIVLSANEQAFPRSKKNNSFIPQDVAKQFQLPTYAELEAITSYHFYRLLQRSKNVALIYSVGSENYGGGEKSRFIYQLEDDLGKKNPLIKVKHQIARFEQGDEEPPIDLKIEKTPEVIKRLKEELRSGVTPLHLNTFISCSIKFYFAHLADLKESSQAEEDLGADKFGVIVHEVLEDLFREMAEPDGFVSPQDIEMKMPFVRDFVTEKFLQNQFSNYALTGVNYLTKEVAIEFVKNFLEEQMKEAEEGKFEIVVLENKEAEEENNRKNKNTFNTWLKLPYKDEEISVRITGIIDRIDKLSGQIRIIDYKTGNVRDNDFKIKESEFERLSEDPELDKLRQLWIYKYVIGKNIEKSSSIELGHHTLSEKEPLVVGVYALREPKKHLVGIKAEKGDSPTFAGNDLQKFIEFSETHLKTILSKILDTSQPFERTSDIERCAYCSFKGICGRN